jgi:hypothetical protein
MLPPWIFQEVLAFPQFVLTMSGLVFVFCAGLLGVGIQLAQVGRHLGDLLPGRVLAARAYLHEPADLSTARKEFYSVGLVGRRRCYRLCGRWLYGLILLTGLKCPYRVYYSPRTRWIWHLEPLEPGSS